MAVVAAVPLAVGVAVPPVGVAAIPAEEAAVPAEVAAVAAERAVRNWHTACASTPWAQKFWPAWMWIQASPRPS